MPGGAAYHLAERHLRQYSGPLDGELFHTVAERYILRTPKTTANKVPTNTEHKNTTSIVAEEKLPNARICSKTAQIQKNPIKPEHFHGHRMGRALQTSNTYRLSNDSPMEG